MFQIFTAVAADLPEIEMLLDAGFGSARRNRSAYRLRDGAAPDLALSFTARDGDTVVGSIQCWPIRLRGTDGRIQPLILLGPVATSAERRGEGIASALIEAALVAVDKAGPTPVFLVGDEPFYGRFGFSMQPAAGWIMPGPVDQARLLVRWTGPALPRAGWVEGKDGLCRAAYGAAAVSAIS